MRPWSGAAAAKEVRFGVVLPGVRLDVAALVERLGFDSLWNSEHILFHFPLHEGLTVLAAYAARTERVQVGTAVLLLALRHPTVVAKSVATVDALSRGRVVLGVGVGGEYPKEFEACGIPLAERGARVDESIDVMRRLWSESHVTHKGRFFSFDDVTMAPQPVQPGGPPIWIGGRSEAAMRRCARVADGYYPYLVTPERFRENFDKVQAWARALGRDPSRIEPALHLFVSLGPTREAGRAFAVDELSRRYKQPFDSIVDRYCAMGSSADCAATVARFIEAGVRHITFVPLCPEARLAEDVEQLAREVVPALGSPESRPPSAG
jgi:probable F420-dependent oxidoreductase